MDADDVLPAESGRLLREITGRHGEPDTAYQVQVRIPPDDQQFSEAIVDHIKLFPNRPDLRFEHRIHEQILPAIHRAGLKVLGSDLCVIHQHYDRSEAGRERKRQRDHRLLQLDLQDRPDHPFVLFNLGMTYLLASGEPEVAAQYLRRSLDLSDWRDSIVRKAYALLATARVRQEDWQAALAVNEEGRRFYPDDAELLFQAGQIYQHTGRLDMAGQALEQLVDGKEEGYYRSTDVGLRTYLGGHELALVVRELGDRARCAQMLRQIAATYPHYLPAQLDLVETLHLVGDRRGAQEFLGRIPRVPSIEPQLQRLSVLIRERTPVSAPEPSLSPQRIPLRVYDGGSGAQL